MKSNQKEIFFNFSYYALNLLGKQMYTSKWSAISELVANGLDAGASIVRVYINSENKEHSTIEIFDDGSGMSYSDLVNKYALIGRNKREEDGHLSNKVKGRKGVGKLAGLFLSKKYYILTKNQGSESAWVLDSTNTRDSDVPRLEGIDVQDVPIENKKLWNSYHKGTLIKLTNVDMTNFAERKLEGLKKRMADYYLLDQLEAKIEVAYKIFAEEEIKFEEVKKDVAFQNFYAFFETRKNLKSQELRKDISVKTSTFETLNKKARQVLVFSPRDISTNFNIKGEKVFTLSNGREMNIPYELTGWIGIHATINSKEAERNDPRFIKNSVYNPNRLKLYVRDKLAVENFLEYLNSNQAFSNYIEGEVSFDVLDNDNLPDISTTSREGFSKDDERVSMLIDILKPIVGKLIRERVKLRQIVKNEEDEIQKKAVEAERIEKEKERQEKEKEMRARKFEEEKSKKLSRENEVLKVENVTLGTQNKMKDVLLSGSDPKRQTLLVHELTGISNQIDYAIKNIAAEFYRTNEFKRVVPYLADLKKGSNKLTTLKQQFLKLNDYDIIGKQDIDLKAYLRSYFANIYVRNAKINLSISDSPFLSRVEVFELGVLLDNLISNAVERNATFIEIIFSDSQEEIHFISDTGPITIKPITDIFKLGVSDKKNGTGIGMYISKEICEEFDWKIIVNDYDNIVEFTIKVGEVM